MADIDLKTETPDTSLPTTGFLFGADSQAASAPSVYSTQTVATTLLGSTSLTGATVTTSSPVIDASQTWNASGVTFTGLRFNATDTASASGSLLMDLQVGGASRFNVGKTGSLKLGVSPTGTNQAGTNVTIAGSQGTGTGAGGSIIFQVAPAGSSGSAQNALADALTIGSDMVVSFAADTIQLSSLSTTVRAGARAVANFSNVGNTTFTLNLRDTTRIGWATSTDPAGASDLLLLRDAANTLALRNGTNAQTFRVYNTTDGTNSEFGVVKWNASPNNFQIGTEKSGTGASKTVDIVVGGTRRVVFGSNNVNYLLTSAGADGITIDAQADGVLRLSNTAVSDFGRLQFGGTTSSFPALKRSTTVLQARLADDSAFATIQGKLRADVNAVAETPTATHTITITDAAGTAYKVLCVAA